jgi:hypothetical protein
MNKKEYIDHKLRIRLLELLSKSTNNKLNALITIAITSMALPIVLKYFGI